MRQNITSGLTDENRFPVKRTDHKDWSFVLLYLVHTGTCHSPLSVCLSRPTTLFSVICLLSTSLIICFALWINYLFLSRSLSVSLPLFLVCFSLSLSLPLFPVGFSMSLSPSLLCLFLSLSLSLQIPMHWGSTALTTPWSEVLWPWWCLSPCVWSLFWEGTWPDIKVTHSWLSSTVQLDLKCILIFTYIWDYLS